MAGKDLKFGMLWTATDKVSAVLGTIGSAFTSVGNIAKKTKLVDGKMVDIDVLKDLNENLRQTRENVDDFANRGEAALRSIIAPTNDVSNAVVGLKPVLRDVSKDAGKSLADIERRAQQWSSAHQQSAADYITASAAMLRATKNEEVSIKGTNVALMVATGATTEAGKAAATLGVLYDVVGNKSRDAGDEIGNIGDVLVRAKQIYGEGFDVGGLIDPLKDAGVTARDAKVPVSQLVGIIGAFNRGGILGGESGKAAQNVIVGLQDASAKLDFQLGKTADGGLDVVKSLQNMRDRFGDLSTMTPELRSHLEQTFGPAWRDVSMLMAQTDRLGTEFDQLGKSQGAAIQAQADAQGTLAAKLAIVNNQVDAVKVNFAQGVLPALEAATPAFGAILGPLGQFIQAHPQLTAIVGTLFVGAVGAAKLGSMMLSTGGAAVNAARGLLAFFVGTGGAASGASVLMAKLSVLGASFVAGATKAWAFTAALLANPITWIVLGIAAAAALIFIYWDPIKKFFVGLWSDVKAAFSQGWVEGILKIIELFNPVTWIAKGLNAVTQYLFGYSLFDAGSNIVNTIVQGITSMASAPVDAMMRIVGKIRNLLPFSPAKEGPLRDLHKVKLIETVAGAVNPTPLVDAMRGAAGTAMAAMTATPMPAFAAMPYVGSSFAGNASNGFGGGGLTMGDLIVQLGSATAREGLAELEAWLRNPTNVRRIAIAVKDHVASQDRAKF